VEKKDKEQNEQKAQSLQEKPASSALNLHAFGGRVSLLHWSWFQFKIAQQARCDGIVFVMCSVSEFVLFLQWFFQLFLQWFLHAEPFPYQKTYGPGNYVPST
jgi:hypothetical protein